MSSEPQIPGGPRKGAFRSDHLANASFACGVVGMVAFGAGLFFLFLTWHQHFAVTIFLCGLPASVLAVWLGHLVRRRITAPVGPTSSGLKSLIGLVMGYSVLLASAAWFLGSALPAYRQARSLADLGRCMGGNLTRIRGAKEQWSVEHRLSGSAPPTWGDLVGPDRYLRNMPVCPNQGRYVLGNPSQPPFCTYHAGWLPQDMPSWAGIVEVVDGRGRRPDLEHIVLYVDRTRYTNDYYPFGERWIPVWHSKTPHLEISSGLSDRKKRRVPVSLPFRWPMIVEVE